MPVLFSFSLLPSHTDGRCYDDRQAPFPVSCKIESGKTTLSHDIDFPVWAAQDAVCRPSVGCLSLSLFSVPSSSSVSLSLLAASSFCGNHYAYTHATRQQLPCACNVAVVRTAHPVTASVLQPPLLTPEVLRPLRPPLLLTDICRQRPSLFPMRTDSSSCLNKCPLHTQYAGLCPPLIALTVPSLGRFACCGKTPLLHRARPLC